MDCCRVMVVDDNPVDRERVRRALRSLQGVQVEVIECEDGSEAIERLQTDPPDLVITDLSMPGFATGYQVEQVATRCGIPVEVMSGLPPLSPYWAGRTRSKDSLIWLRDAVLHQGQRQPQAQARPAGPLRRALMGAGGAVVVVLCALLSGWM